MQMSSHCLGNLDFIKNGGGDRFGAKSYARGSREEQLGLGGNKDIQEPHWNVLIPLVSLTGTLLSFDILFFICLYFAFLICFMFTYNMDCLTTSYVVLQLLLPQCIGNWLK